MVVNVNIINVNMIKKRKRLNGNNNIVIVAK
jgi:hypothetical protein